MKINLKFNGKYTLFVLIVILCALFGVLNPVFLSLSNLINVVDQISLIGIISLGMTLVILIGGIDLSVGSIVSFSGIVFALLLSRGLSFPICLLICLGTGCVFGCINGFFISYGKVPAFIVTLGTMSLGRGAALYLTDGRSISGLPDSLSNLVNYSVLRIPFSVIILLSLLLIFYLFLKYTYWGKYIYAIGSNEKAAWLSGIQINKYKVLVYVVSGLVSAISCILLTGKLDSAQPTAGNLYELNAIAAVIIGGASLTGGKANIINTFLGVLILGVLQNGFSILNIPSYYQQMLIGIIIILAVLTDYKSNKPKSI